MNPLEQFALALFKELVSGMDESKLVELDPFLGLYDRKCTNSRAYPDILSVSIEDRHSGTVVVTCGSVVLDLEQLRGVQGLSPGSVPPSPVVEIWFATDLDLVTGSVRETDLYVEVNKPECEPGWSNTLPMFINKVKDELRKHT